MLFWRLKSSGTSFSTALSRPGWTLAIRFHFSAFTLKRETGLRTRSEPNAWPGEHPAKQLAAFTGTRDPAIVTARHRRPAFGALNHRQEWGRHFALLIPNKLRHLALRDFGDFGAFLRQPARQSFNCVARS